MLFKDIQYPQLSRDGWSLIVPGRFFLPHKKKPENEASRAAQLAEVIVQHNTRQKQTASTKMPFFVQVYYTTTRKFKHTNSH